MLAAVQDGEKLRLILAQQVLVAVAVLTRMELLILAVVLAQAAQLQT